MDLKTWLTEHGLTQAAAADRLGLSRPYLTHILREGAPSDLLKIIIEFETGGAVAFEDWRAAALRFERQRLADGAPARHPRLVDALEALK